ncbi:hypothetical protein [Roseomonas indoligenes]|uniref:Uncharacterized protein n=1 Tax=Roseomonas indoligenes TaxID=2820811 RepID=A0A940N1P9_9PROT|nr:hypothetical protein [Pararoseomonas indoligenes]MBP0494934.1 hypothetical protein [Pararoseomonas indoligenes]
MRFSEGSAANTLAWGVLGLLFCASVAMVTVLGFVGLLLLGGLTTLVCVLAELNQDTPTWGIGVFKARMDSSGSPEQRAAMLADRQTLTSPIRFYRRCGLALVGLGIAGAIFQAWRP